MANLNLMFDQCDTLQHCCHCAQKAEPPWSISRRVSRIMYFCIRLCLRLCLLLSLCVLLSLGFSYARYYTCMYVKCVYVQLIIHTTHSYFIYLTSTSLNYT